MEPKLKPKFNDVLKEVTNKLLEMPIEELEALLKESEKNMEEDPVLADFYAQNWAIINRSS